MAKWVMGKFLWNHNLKFDRKQSTRNWFEPHRTFCPANLQCFAGQNVRWGSNQFSVLCFRSILLPFPALCDMIHYSGLYCGAMTSCECHGFRQKDMHYLWGTTNNQYMYLHMCLSPGVCLSGQKGLLGKRIVDYGRGRWVNTGAFF